MTVERINIFSGPYLANGATTVFPITFNAASGDEVLVTRNGQELNRSLYRVALNPDRTGSVTFTVPPTGSIVIYSDPEFTQETNFEDQGPFLQSSVNEPIDRSAVRDLVLLDGVKRSIRAPRGEPQLPELPAAVARAGMVVGFGADGGLVLYSPNIPLTPPPPPPVVGVASDEVDVSTYPGTTVASDPQRLDHDNARFKNAQLDVKNPASVNFGKALRFRLLKGSGQLVLTDYDGKPVPQLDASNDPADPEMNAKVGDWLLDNWSPNGIVPDDYPASPIIPNPSDPGNWLSGVVIRCDVGVRFRRPHRRVMRPFILNCEPVPSAATTDPVTGIDTQEDVFVGNRLEGFPAFIGENHWRHYSQHANNIQVSAVTDFYCEARGYGPQSDLLYIGATSVGGGKRNAHNKRVEYYCIADGYNQNNRNVVSVIDVDGEKGWVWARRFSKFGGPGDDNSNPNSGVGAPGVHDSEPNASFTDDPIYRNSDVEIYAEDCGSPGALFLPENGSFPNPCRNIRRKVTHIRCGHGYISATKSNPLVSYAIEVDVTCDHSDRALEVLSGGGHFKVNAEDCPKATYVGYFGSQTGDLFLSGVMRRCGTAAGVVIESRGWDGGGARGLRILDSTNLIGIRHIPVTGQLTRNLTFDDVEFGAGLVYAQFVDIGADVRPGSISERGVKYNGVGNYRWRAVGAPLKSIPAEGNFVIGQEWPTAPSLEPGSPRTIRSLATNTGANRPVMIQQDQIAGFVDPIGVDMSGYTFLNMIQDKAGMLRATAANARAVKPNAVGSGTMTFRMPYSGSQLVYIGFANRPDPTNASHLIVGIWAGDTTGEGTGKAVAIASGESAGGATFKYNDPASIVFSGGSSVSVVLNGATVYSSPIAAGSAYPVVLIGAAGEKVLITGAA